MPLLDREVVVRPEDVGRHHRGPLAAVLLRVASVLHVDHPLRVGVALVGLVRRSVVDHRLVDRIPERWDTGRLGGGREAWRRPSRP